MKPNEVMVKMFFKAAQPVIHLTKSLDNANLVITTETVDNGNYTAL